MKRSVNFLFKCQLLFFQKGTKISAKKNFLEAASECDMLAVTLKISRQLEVGYHLQIKPDISDGG